MVDVLTAILLVVISVLAAWNMLQAASPGLERRERVVLLGVGVVLASVALHVALTAFQ